MFPLLFLLSGTSFFLRSFDHFARIRQGITTLNVPPASAGAAGPFDSSDRSH